MITKKNLLSLLLTIAMLLSLITVVPVTASADEEPYIASDFLMAKIYSGTQRLTAKQYSDQIGCTFSEKDSYIVRTGTKAKMYNKEYTVVVMGDCSPDGKVDATDIITIKRHLLKISTLEGIYAESVSFDGTGKISSTDYIRVKRYMLGIVDRLQIGSAINPQEVIGSSVVRYVRSVKNQSGAALTVHSIASGMAEASEFLVDSSTMYRGIPLRSIHLKKNVLLACISRHGNLTIPNGDSFFEEGDTLLIVTASNTVIERLNDIFE